MTSGSRVCLALAFVFALGVGSAKAGPYAQQDPAPSAPVAQAPDPQTPATAEWSVNITSPLGRTGVITKVRIVAQILGVPAEQQPVRAFFYVDGKLLGEVAAPPYVVDWVDDNPFEQREIVVQAQDAQGRVASDKVILPKFEITDQSEVTSVLLEAGVHDKQGRFIADLDPSSFVVRENGVPQKTDNVARQTVPTTVVLLVDNSQSMSRRIDFVRQAAERLGDGAQQAGQDHRRALQSSNWARLPARPTTPGRSARRSPRCGHKGGRRLSTASWRARGSSRVPKGDGRSS